jgi:hypothetical protein
MDDAISLDASIDRFFLRAGLATRERLRCDAFIRTRYPDEQITPVSGQGYCSLTVFVGDTLVVQFRPPLFQLDLRVAHAARDVYGPFAPDTRYLGTLPSGLLAYSMSRIDGLSLQHWRRANPAAQSTEQRRRLCRDFVGFLARAWHHQSRTDLPLGVVGLSLVSRLKALMTDLPVRFQSTARSLLRQLHRIEALPWVLSHGDIMAANMMVDPSSCRLIGLVDWAEAERLPFGVCFYGLEEILGEMTPSGFRLHPDSKDLRASFWEELKRQIPELQQSHVLEAVKLARDLGILLWHGIAFDNGAINRVVEEGRDVEEIQRLDAFLDLHPEQHRDHFQGLSSKTLPIPSSTSIAPTLLPYP